MGVKASGGRVAGAIRFVILSHAISLVVLVGILWELTCGGAAWSCGGVGDCRRGDGSAGAGGVLYCAEPGRDGRVGGGERAAGGGDSGAGVECDGGCARGDAAGVDSVLAGGAIWLIAAGDSPEKDFPEKKSGGTMALAIFAGVAFGVYFVALKLSNPLGLLMPMTIARVSSVVLCSVILVVMAVAGGRQIQPTSQKRDVGHPVSGRWLAGWGWACGVALLDTGGNVLFLAATRMGRLDVASVLASLYPAGTILLAAWYLHERPTRRQTMGMVAALAAVVMITL